MIDPEFAAAMLASAATSTSHPGPIIPTVVQTGKRTLWVGFALMTLTAGIFSLFSWNVPVSKRVYHVVATLAAVISALAYFAAATGQTSSLACHPVRDHHEHVPDTWHDACRQLFWARYIDWFFSTPLVLLNLCLLGGVSGAHTLAALVANAVVVVAGWAAAYGTYTGANTGGDSHQKTAIWGWFAIASVAYLVVVWHVGLHGTSAVRNKGARLMKLWTPMAVYILAVWAAYVVVWAIAPLAHRTTVDAEIITYLVLDILAKSVFGFWLLITHRNVAESSINLNGYWSQGLAAEGLIRIEDE
ncbi:hypothetical protein VTJ83DRAFT_6102 [Remersonia thermophila]|uniref:Opsin n=1 Tax=Remersonia thermophila TaxID=72144 RepID=A0ABR4D8V6_9PEZI